MSEVSVYLPIIMYCELTEDCRVLIRDRGVTTEDHGFRNEDRGVTIKDRGVTTGYRGVMKEGDQGSRCNNRGGSRIAE